MQLKTILNRVHKIKGFVYKKAEFSTWGKDPSIEVEIQPRKGNQAICSGCGQKRAGYDNTTKRRYEFIPIWGYRIFLIYIMRRVNCPQCGIRTEQVPWGEGKKEITTSYLWYLSTWAKRLSWEEVAECFHTSWYYVYRAVEMAVEWGRSHIDLEGIEAIGIDEIQWSRGHGYVTLVYQISQGCKRLLWVGEKRKVKTLLRYFRWFGEERSAKLKYICSDMWKPYLKVIRKKAGQAIHILDRFHIVAHMNKAIDEVRAQEARELKKNGHEPVLKKSRWLFLKRSSNLTQKQMEKLSNILRYNLKTVRSYLLKEDFHFFREYRSSYWAGKFLDRWCTKTMRSRIEPMKKVAKMLRNHKELILNWFRAQKQFSSGVVEGLNNKAKLTTKKAYGFRTYRALEVALYHTLGDLPEPKFTHRFF